MDNYKDLATAEFRAAGWVSPDGSWVDEKQKEVCENVLALLEDFARHNYNVVSAPYVVDLFSRLALKRPITPLTGEDWEWMLVADHGDELVYQNIRLDSVFKSVYPDGSTYFSDIDDTVYWIWSKAEGQDPVKMFFTKTLPPKERNQISFPYIQSLRYVFSPTEEFPHKSVTPIE